jgi:hypothetical protein
MQRIFTAATLIEAHLIQQMLEAESIRAAVFNENAHGAAGELPITEVWPEVWIEDDGCCSAARSIIERYEATSNGEMPTTCAQCGERNPKNFELCWYCGEILQTEE